MVYANYLLVILLIIKYLYQNLPKYCIMEQLTTLRAEVVQQLLENTGNIKIKRLFLYMAQKAGHEWFGRLDTSRIKLGTGKQKLVDNGFYLPEYMITIPKELYHYE